MTANLLIVAGPTASGKSDIALKLAHELNAEIVSVDSVQVYRGLNIGSAKPSIADQEQIKHHLIDIREPNQPINAAEFAAEATQAISKIVAAKKLPILVAGTTLYLKAILYGLAEMPGANPAERERMEALSSDVLYAQLQQKDPKRAEALHPNDRLRIIRALEILNETELSNIEVYASHAKSLKYNGLMLALDWQREVLHQRIAKRVDSMLALGIVDEVKTLIGQFGEDNHWIKSVGYAQCAKHLRGELSKEELRDRIIFATRQLAKRQLTFLRNEPEKLSWSISNQDSHEEFPRILSMIRERMRQPISGIELCNWTQRKVSAPLNS